MQIIHDADSFISAAEEIFEDTEKDHWLRTVDHFLENDSWDHTFNKMKALIDEVNVEKVQITNTKKQINHV